jgi:hypothetical protein
VNRCVPTEDVEGLVHIRISRIPLWRGNCNPVGAPVNVANAQERIVDEFFAR